LQLLELGLPEGTYHLQESQIAHPAK